MSTGLGPTAFIDSDHPDVAAFAERHTVGVTSPTDQAVKLYYAVRDGIRYDPYRLVLTEQGLRASTCLQNGYGWCVTKAALYAATCRAIGIPARLGYADVRNHLSTARLREFLGTDVFYFHGYTSIELEGTWVKATPAFNIELCRKFRIRSLEFDGRQDSIYHPFDLEGRRHMEYLRFRGEYDDLPRDEMIAVFAEHYSRSGLSAPEGDFEKDVEEETREIVS